VRYFEYKKQNCFNIRTQNVLAKVEEERISAKEFWNEVLNYVEKQIIG
jgi:hypothetical protein